MSDQLEWGVEWHSKSEVDGERRFIMWAFGHPLAFFTRKAAKDWIDENYGYIKKRPDLKGEPHGWRLPQPIRIRISVEKVES